MKLSGAYWGMGCDDSGTSSSGAGRSTKSARPITIRIFQGNRSYLLTKVNPDQVKADAGFSFEATATLPSTIKPGAATIKASLGDSVSKPHFEDAKSGRVDSDGQTTIKIVGKGQAT